VRKIAGLLLFFYFLSLFVANSLISFPNQQYNQLAESFINGRLSFLEKHGQVYDSSLYKGRLYWASGFFPAVFLIPSFLILGPQINHQSVWTFWLTLGLFFILKRLLEYFNVKNKNLNWLILLFLAGTPYFGVSHFPMSWFFAHVVATFLIFLSFLIFLRKKKYFFSGMLIGLSTLTRTTTLFYMIFFISYLLLNRRDKNIKLNLLKLLLPFLVCMILMLVYNKMRFDSFWETGYMLQDTGKGIPAQREQLGLINIRYFLPHLLKLLFCFGAKRFGVGIVFTMPILFYLYKTDIYNKMFVPVLTAIIPLMIALLISFSKGGMQYGNRLSLDFLPLVFLLFITLFKEEVGKKAKIIILIQVFINIYLVFPDLFLALS